MTKYTVKRVFVKILFDIDCSWTETAPSYRVFVNDELFSERTFIWRDKFLTETLQVEAEPGSYCVRVEALDGADFKITNRQIEHGPARWVDNDNVVIDHES